MTDHSKKIVIALIGLPARGKSYVSKKLRRYFNWLNVPCQIFNVGNYRRQFEGQYGGNNFFDATNTAAQDIRQLSADAGMNDMIDWLVNRNGEIAFYDATNTTRDRRQWIKNRVGEAQLDLMFLEILCDDQDTINENIEKVKLHTDDYVNIERNVAIEDFKTRIGHYEAVYEPLDETFDQHLSFIQIINKGASYKSNKIDTVYKAKVLNYVQGIRLCDRTVLLCTGISKQMKEFLNKNSANVITVEENENDEISINESQLNECITVPTSNKIAAQLDGLIIDLEKYETLTIHCGEKVSRSLLNFFELGQSPPTTLSDISSAFVVRISCNRNIADYTVEFATVSN